jgi:hypothetical protein
LKTGREKEDGEGLSEHEQLQVKRHRKTVESESSGEGEMEDDEKQKKKGRTTREEEQDAKVASHGRENREGKRRHDGRNTGAARSSTGLDGRTKAMDCDWEEERSPCA